MSDPQVGTLALLGCGYMGGSLALAARLAEAGVNLVQVNLGNNETWDTHGNAFPHLREKLLPPTDRSVTALITDLDQRTPTRRHSPHRRHRLPQRDHRGQPVAEGRPGQAGRRADQLRASV